MSVLKYRTGLIFGARKKCYKSSDLVDFGAGSGSGRFCCARHAFLALPRWFPDLLGCSPCLGRVLNRFCYQKPSVYLRQPTRSTAPPPISCIRENTVESCNFGYFSVLWEIKSDRGVVATNCRLRVGVFRMLPRVPVDGYGFCFLSGPYQLAGVAR